MVLSLEEDWPIPPGMFSETGNAPNVREVVGELRLRSGDEWCQINQSTGRHLLIEGDLWHSLALASL